MNFELDDPFEPEESLLPSTSPADILQGRVKVASYTVTGNGIFWKPCLGMSWKGSELREGSDDDM